MNKYGLAARREFRYTPDMSKELFDAIRNGDAEKVKTILGEEPALLMAKDETGVSPLLNALYNQKQEIADLLMTMDPGLSVYEASALGKNERVQELIDADPELAVGYSPDGWTALHLAAFFGHPDVIETLLDHGAGIDMVSNSMGNTALQAAVAGNQTEAVRVLVERGADLAYKTAHGGYAAVHNAASIGNEEIMKMLLDAGADPKVEALDGRTPSMIAEGKHSGIVAMLDSSEDAD